MRQVANIFKKFLTTSKTIINFAPAIVRKDAGVVDRDGLENRCTLTGTQGSNPCLSAINAENQQIVKQAPNFTPKSVKLGAFVLFKIYT